eukprot:TRINITY_DN17707_c0_g1_i1.p1 TRINITY_DN17707_c0_g1~~TRINITY_DN17707_c0_g1_i1.p1  ORF type:complete len:294 (+),score=50.93 TRINITY_DN17707_c0_g1_i1:57-884(+)
MSSDAATLPSVPCAKMPKKQRRIAASGDSTLMDGVDPKDRYRILLEAMIKRKEERCVTTRCERCWFPVNSSGTNYCVCAKMPPLNFGTRSRFLIYMHPRDWYNAGDDAKILFSAAPGRTDLFVFGRDGDDQRLRDAIASSEAVALLFPDEDALLVPEFMAQLGTRKEESSGTCSAPPAVSIVVIDGTWNNVRQVLKHFCREVGPQVPHVRLEPTALSVYARTQTRKDGVSSVEAIALLLLELGETRSVCDELVRYITVNNEALRLRPPSADDEDC